MHNLYVTIQSFMGLDVISVGWMFCFVLVGKKALPTLSSPATSSVNVTVGGATLPTITVA
jgi:hypothetical protein